MAQHKATSPTPSPGLIFLVSKDAKEIDTQEEGLKKSGERAVKLHERMIEVYKRERIADDTAKKYNVAMAMDSHGRIYFAMGATRDLNPSLHTVETLRGSKIVTTADTGLGEMPAVTDPKQERLLFHAEQKLLAFAQKNNIELVEIHSVFKVCEDDYLPARSCSSVLREHGFVALKGGPTQYQGRIYFKAETLARSSEIILGFLKGNSSISAGGKSRESAIWLGLFTCRLVMLCVGLDKLLNRLSQNLY